MDTASADDSAITAPVVTGSHLLTDPRHEAFAQHVSCGMDPAEACRKVYRCKAATAQTKSLALLAEPDLAQRITALQHQASHIAGQHCSFGKAQLIAFLVETIQTPPSSIDAHHRQCQEWTRDELSTGGRRPRATTASSSQTNPSEQKTPSTPIAKSGRKAAGKPTTGPGDQDSRAGDTSDSPPKDSPPAGAASPEAATAILIRSKTKLPSKLDAAKLLATLCGWNAPTKLEGKVNLGISPTVEEALSRLLE